MRIGRLCAHLWFLSLVAPLVLTGCPSSRDSVSQDVPVSDTGHDAASDAVADVSPDVTAPPADVTPTDIADASKDVPMPPDVPVELAEETVCAPDCGGKECGDDGCGGVCGNCPAAAPVCKEGLCHIECTPDCDGKECGDDGCGGVCGKCPAAAPICEEGMCQLECVPDCEGKACGEDGCGGSCGECGGAQETCVAGACVCQPACAGKECGSDGCGGSCGTCAGAQTTCDDGSCVCQPACAGKECGGDGCGGSCGVCPDAEICFGGQCAPAGDTTSCADILVCASTCVGLPGCVESCMQAGDAAGQAAYLDAQTCVQAACGDDSFQTATAQYCAILNCPAQWTTCVGPWGTKNCQGMLVCLQDCNTDVGCQWACILEGSKTGQTAFWKMQACFYDFCAQCGQDGACMQQCVTQHCWNEVMACQGP